MKNERQHYPYYKHQPDNCLDEHTVGHINNLIFIRAELIQRFVVSMQEFGRRSFPNRGMWVSLKAVRSLIEQTRREALSQKYISQMD